MGTKKICLHIGTKLWGGNFLDKGLLCQYRGAAWQTRKSITNLYCEQLVLFDAP